MNKEFKSILVKIASLSVFNQQWIIQQLTPKHQELFHANDGPALLHKARRFRNVTCPNLPIQTAVNVVCLPKIADYLQKCTPLYSAIILEQGQFIWQTLFLALYPEQEEIVELINNHLPLLKTATKVAVFKQWQNQLPFNEQLESIGG